MLRAEGFTDVRYVQGDPKVDQAVWIARGETDFSLNHPPLHITSIDAGVPIKVLAGLHSGCLELIANESVRSVADLRGKRVGVDLLNSTSHVMLTSVMAAYVGLDPAKDIQWIVEEVAPRSCSSKERSMHSSARHLVRRSCGQRKSAIRSSTRPPISRGHSISAA